MRNTEKRHDYWGEYEWRDTIGTLPVRKTKPERKRAVPWSMGDAAIAAAIVGVIAWFVALGPWL